MSARKTDLSAFIEATLGLADLHALVTGRAAAKVSPNLVSYPFRTESAVKVWEAAKEVMREFPHLDRHQMLLQAVHQSGVPTQDLTSEDWRLLEMAIEAMQAAPRWMPPSLGDEIPKAGSY